jgi:hypothetical protein
VHRHHHASSQRKTPNSEIETHGGMGTHDGKFWYIPVMELRMPIKLPPVSERDLVHARQIARSWKLFDKLSPTDVEIVARAIAQGIAEGRMSGLEIAQGCY